MLGKATAPHSSTLAWKIPWTEEPGRLQSMGSWRVGHDWATSLSLFTFMHWRRKWQPTPVFLPGEYQGRDPGGLPSMGSHRVGHDWRDLAAENVRKHSPSHYFLLGTQKDYLSQYPLGWGGIMWLSADQWECESKELATISSKHLRTGVNSLHPFSLIQGLLTKTS